MGEKLDKLRRAIAEKPAKAPPPVAVVPPVPAPKPARKPKPPRIDRGGPHARDTAMANAGRLPDGSRFDVVYDAAAVQWSGTLVVGGVMLRETASGVFKLLAKLDRAWRATLTTDATPEALASGG